MQKEHCIFVVVVVVVDTAVISIVVIMVNDHTTDEIEKRTQNREKGKMRNS